MNIYRIVATFSYEFQDWHGSRQLPTVHIASESIEEAMEQIARIVIALVYRDHKNGKISAGVVDMTTDQYYSIVMNYDNGSITVKEG